MVRGKQPKTSLLTRLIGTVKQALHPEDAHSNFGYHAIASQGRRPPTPYSQRSEDATLPAAQRGQLISTARDCERNISLGGFALRTHLDYVSSFGFRARTRDNAFNSRLEELVEWNSQPAKFDIAGRHSFADARRIVEARRVVDGDCLTVRLRSGHIQLIESDRIRSWPGAYCTDPKTGNSIVNGVEVDGYGKAISYRVSDRDPWGFYIKGETRTVPASEAHLFAYFTRVNQVRGISPLASGLNAFRDVYSVVILPWLG